MIIIKKVTLTGIILFFFLFFLTSTFILADEKTIKPPEKPIKVIEVEVQGNSKVQTREIISEIKTKPGDTFDVEKLQKDIQAIYNIGYFTDVKLNIQSVVGGVKVIFTVLENPVIRQVVFTGNNIVDSSKLLNLINSAPGRILNLRIIKEDELKINFYYQTLGYIGLKTNVKNVDFAKGVLTFTLVDGIEIKEIKINGNTVVPSAVLYKAVQSKVGGLFNQETIGKDRDAIASYYRKNSYIIKDIIIDQRVISEGKLHFQIVEAVIGEITTEGNKKTKTYVVLRTIRSKKGEIANVDKIIKDIQRIQATGLFDTVTVATTKEGLLPPGPLPNTVTLKFIVKEPQTFGSYGGGGSFSGGPRGEGLSFTFSVTHRNLGGTGKSLRLSLQEGTRVTSYMARYSDPWLGMSPVQTSFSLTYYSQDLLRQQYPIGETSPLQYALYRDRRIGMQASLGREIGEFTRAYITYKREKIKITPTPDPEYPFLADLKIDNGNLRSISLSIIDDRRDDPLDPKRGSVLKVSYERAGDFLGGDFNFQKYQIEYRKYWFLKGNSILAFRFWNGLSSGNLPLTEKYYVGGTDTLRGYKEGEFIGDKLILINGEFRFPLLKSKILHGVLFADFGNSWNKGQTLAEAGGIKHSYGLGLRVKTLQLGMGVVRLDYAFAPGGRRETQFGFGQSF